MYTCLPVWFCPSVMRLVGMFIGLHLVLTAFQCHLYTSLSCVSMRLSCSSWTTVQIQRQPMATLLRVYLCCVNAGRQLLRYDSCQRQQACGLLVACDYKASRCGASGRKSFLLSFLLLLSLDDLSSSKHEVSCAQCAAFTFAKKSHEATV